MKKKVREYRKQREMTQKQLADTCGVTSRSIIAIEKGEYNPCLILAFALSRALETSMEELFCLEENSQASNHMCPDQNHQDQ
ncbi:MAG: helix-turn-helix transcriptional regulator [Parasporobacterium sp.]|nr:helix-turn-helix transcriptional regulator [Parasporobacterium sp.]